MRCLAQDTTELERLVAIKVLPTEFASDKARLHRFIQEAKTASSLNHPNILNIYEIGETDSTRFIAIRDNVFSFVSLCLCGEWQQAAPHNRRQSRNEACCETRNGCISLTTVEPIRRIEIFAGAKRRGAGPRRRV